MANGRSFRMSTIHKVLLRSSELLSSMLQACRTASSYFLRDISFTIGSGRAGICTEPLGGGTSAGSISASLSSNVLPLVSSFSSWVESFHLGLFHFNSLPSLCSLFMCERMPLALLHWKTQTRQPTLPFSTFNSSFMFDTHQHQYLSAFGWKSSCYTDTQICSIIQRAALPTRSSQHEEM